MLISVTQEHIDRGQKSHGDQCPVALALVDAGFQRQPLTVLHERAYYRSNGVNYKVNFPIRATRFIKKIDAGKKAECKPFRFWINLPE